MARNDWEQIVNTDPRGLSADGLTLVSFTTSAAIFPSFVLPANFLRTGRLLNIRARGIWAATATPTYTFRLQGTAGTVVTIVTSAAITVSALTNEQWIWNMQVKGVTEGVTGTVMGAGDLTMGGVAGFNLLPAAATAPATATVDTTIAQTWQLEIACSASSASNTVKGLILEVSSLN